MLTPQDIKDKKFEKALVGGYEMSLVDDFLERVMEDYAALYRDNAVLKSKLKVLVEKVEEYRSTEDSMRMALLTAQKMASQITDEANAKAEEILAKAQGEVGQRQKEIGAAVQQQEAKLEEAKQKTDAFSRKVLALLSEQQEFIAGLEDFIIDPVAVPQETPAQIQATRVQEAAAQHNLQESYVLTEESYDTERKAETQEDDFGFDLDALKNSVDAFMAEGTQEEKPEEVQTSFDTGNSGSDFKMFDQEHLDEQFAKSQGLKGGSEQSFPIPSTNDRDLEKAEITRSISQALGDDEEIIIDSKIFDDEGSPTTTRPKFDFGDLQFGANYDIED